MAPWFVTLMHPHLQGSFREVSALPPLMAALQKHLKALWNVGFQAVVGWLATRLNGVWWGDLYYFYGDWTNPPTTAHRSYRFKLFDTVRATKRGQPGWPWCHDDNCSKQGGCCWTTGISCFCWKSRWEPKGRNQQTKLRLLGPSSTHHWFVVKAPAFHFVFVQIHLAWDHQIVQWPLTIPNQNVVKCVCLGLLGRFLQILNSSIAELG